MTFNDFKAYRICLQPVFRLKKWRESRGSSKFWSNVRFTIFIVGAVLFGSCRICHAQESSDVQIVNAIYLAEGGNHAKYPFGIRSIPCSEYTTCRKICLTTVKHNHRRYSEYGFKTSPSFIMFLANRYCPTRGNISRTEKRLNKNWVKNVNFFLKEKI